MNQPLADSPARPRSALSDSATNARLQASYRLRDKGDRQFVEALARGLAILRAFRAADRFLANQEISKRTGLPKPTVSRLTHTLTEMGFLNHVAQRDEYALGVGVLALGHAYLAALNVRDVARPFMEELASFAKATVSLGEADGPNMVILEICHGSPTYRLRLEIGERVPHNSTALGRAYLAGMAEEQRTEAIAAIVERRPLEEREAFTQKLRHSLSDFDRDGFVASFGDWKPDIFSVGVPLVSADGTRIFSLSCSGPAFDMTRRRLMSELAPRIVELRDRVLQATHGLF